MKRWTVAGLSITGDRARKWAYVHDMGLVVSHCCHMTALRPYYATYNGLFLTKKILCRSMAAVYGWQSTEEEFEQAADQLLAVRHLRTMQNIAEHWLNAKGSNQ